MTIEIKDLDFNIKEQNVKLDIEIIRDILLSIKEMLDDLESRVTALEGP